MNPSQLSPARLLPVFVFGFLSTARALVIDGSIAQDDYGEPRHERARRICRGIPAHDRFE
ncbi:MAG TPA: hypothetical protein VMN36_03950 [Verrucomicrobiales bacterium]|nr:hypothetical protein [Verrucomicrobiales bacterium]